MNIEPDGEKLQLIYLYWEDLKEEIQEEIMATMKEYGLEPNEEMATQGYPYPIGNIPLNFDD